MPLRFAVAPPNGTQLVQDALSRITARTSAHAPAPRTLTSVVPALLRVASPHAVYDLRADDVSPLIPACRDVPDGTGKREAQWS